MKTVDLLQALIAGSVEFVLVSGMAMQLHGYARMTYDIDLVLAMSNANLTRFIVVARSFGLTPVVPVSIESLKDAGLMEQWNRDKGMLAFALREPGVGGSVVDVLVRPDVSYERLAHDAVHGALFGAVVKIASIEHLLEMKRIATAPKTSWTSLRWRGSSDGKIRVAESSRPSVRASIPHETMIAVLNRCDDTREFTVQMWLQNSHLAKQGAALVAALLSPSERCG